MPVKQLLHKIFAAVNHRGCFRNLLIDLIPM